MNFDSQTLTHQVIGDYSSSSTSSTSATSSKRKSSWPKLLMKRSSSKNVLEKLKESVKEGSASKKEVGRKTTPPQEFWW